MGRYISSINTNSYQGNELLLLKQGIAKNHKEFLTTGTDTWTIDRDVIVRVRVWGGGGGGGGGHYNGLDVLGAPGNGGGAGGIAEAILRLSAGTYNITVGAGGAAGKTSGQNGAGATSGTRGGSSSFHTYITCSGGEGGPEGSLQAAAFGGRGGAASFNWSGFDGLLYADGRLGGAGGNLKSGYYVSPSSNSGDPDYRFFSCGSEKGVGESGGMGGYTWEKYAGIGFVTFSGGGGGGYNPPFIYGVDKTTGSNSGRGVGAGGAGAPGYFTTPPTAGNSGAVVLEWN